MVRQAPQAPAATRELQLLPLRGAASPGDIATSRPDTRNTETPPSLAAKRAAPANQASRPRRSPVEDAGYGKTRSKNKPVEHQARQKPPAPRPASVSARYQRTAAAPDSSRRSATTPASR